MALIRRCLLVRVLVAATLAVLPLLSSQLAAQEPVDGHPRLWLSVEDLPRLRAWANDANPIWRDGLAPLAERMKADMDEGRVPGADDAGRGWSQYPTESYAELFAFLSLVHPDAAARQDYAVRARTLLMHGIDEAAKGPAVDAPFRAPDFMAPHSDRARWWGEAWALTVDWIYPSLSAADKATIHAVFLRWCEEIATQGYNHPEPVGLTNDPVLLADRAMLRWSGNNYFTSHMRNLGLMALSLDPADDPGGELRAYLDIATGAHLYMTDRLLRTDAAGGIAPEGFEYSPQALGYVVQFLLALETAGLVDPARFGPQVVLDDNPFWTVVVPAHLHSMSPRTTVIEGMESFGDVYLPNWFGDGELYFAPDMIWLLGPLGLHDRLTGNRDRLDQIRWVETHLAPGGEDLLAIDRVANADGSALLTAILYFMLFDPADPQPPDPRPAQANFHFAPGIGRLMARTGWDQDATWFTYGLGWIGIDHQMGDGNTFSFYRNGEWLTKNLVGYGGEFGDDDPSDDYYYPSSDHQNTLALENDEPFSNTPSDYRSQLYSRGSQWEYVAAGDPTILALSVQPGFAYALGDATNLYNSTVEGAMDIVHASRSILWLPPDAIVVYDRATSRTDGRFKRFWLNLLSNASVDGMRTTMPSQSGQQLVIDTLLPANVSPSVEPQDGPIDTLAVGEPMRFRFLVEAPDGPRDVRFLNVLQAADSNNAVSEPILLQSDDGAFIGAAVGTGAVLFPTDVGSVPALIRYIVPSETLTHLITGLSPDAGYDVSTGPAQGGKEISVIAGTTHRTDAGGVLRVGELPARLSDSSFAFTNPLTPIAAADGTIETNPDQPIADEPARIENVAQDTAEFEDTVAPVQGGAAATGSGWIVFEAWNDASQSRHLYRIAATAGAMPQDISQALDALDPMPDEWIAIAPDGDSLLIGTERFDSECAGWPCLAVIPADLSSGELVRTGAGVIHSEGFGAIASGGHLIVYPASGGPHALDLWAVQRHGDGWDETLLLTGASPYAFHHTAAISADGAQVVFDCGNQPYGEDGTALCIAATDGSSFRVVLTPDNAPAGVVVGGALHHPDFASNDSILFQSRWTDSVWRLPPQGGAPLGIGTAFGGDGAPCVLADGRIASLWLGRPGSDGTSEIKIMTPDGTDYAMLLTGIHVEDIGCGG